MQKGRGTTCKNLFPRDQYEKTTSVYMDPLRPQNPNQNLLGGRSAHGLGLFPTTRPRPLINQMPTRVLTASHGSIPIYILRLIFSSLVRSSLPFLSPLSSFSLLAAHRDRSPRDLPKPQRFPCDLAPDRFQSRTVFSFRRIGVILLALLSLRSSRSLEMASNVSTVYVHVIDDVVAKVREEFVNSGAGEAVLNELQAVISRSRSFFRNMFDFRA